MAKFHKVTIFLDIDGVLTSEITRDFLNDGKMQAAFNPIAVGMINELALRYDIDFVISSDWRNHFDYQAMKTMLMSQGLYIPLHSAWKIKGERVEGIKNWLKDHPNSKFIIVDDFKITDQSLRFKQVWTCPTEGLNIHTYRALKEKIENYRRM